MARVLKPSGSIFVNLGDKMANKSLMLLPERYRIRARPGGRPTLRPPADPVHP